MNYPKYRAHQWLDTSPKAMRRKQATVLYGIQTQREKGGKWMHCHKGGEPMIFRTPEQASAAIDALKHADGVLADQQDQEKKHG